MALDFAGLGEFMRGLDEATVTAGGWMVQQALAQGAHGVHLARSRDPEGVKRFVQAARYPIRKQATDTLGVGLRGLGSHTLAAWGLGPERPGVSAGRPTCGRSSRGRDSCLASS